MTKISARDLCAGCGLLVSIRTIQRHKHRILAGFTCGDRKGRKAALHYLPKLAGGVKDVREVNGWEHVARNGNNAEYAQAGRSSDEATVGEVVHPNEFEGDGEAQMLNHNNEDAYASGNCDGIRRAPCGNAGGDSNIHEDAHMHADSSNDIDIDIDAHANDDGLRLVLGRTTSSPELSIVDAYVFQTERRMLRDAGILPPLPAIFPSKGRDGDTPKAGDIILLGRSRRVTLVQRTADCFFAMRRFVGSTGEKSEDIHSLGYTRTRERSSCSVCLHYKEGPNDEVVEYFATIRSFLRVWVGSVSYDLAAVQVHEFVDGFSPQQLRTKSMAMKQRAEQMLQLPPGLLPSFPRVYQSRFYKDDRFVPLTSISEKVILAPLPNHGRGPAVFCVLPSSYSLSNVCTSVLD
eukprot:Opistho-2@35120